MINKARSHRLPTALRTGLSEQDWRYIKMRAEGRSVEAAAKELGRPPAEMQHIENDHPLMSDEILKARKDITDENIQTGSKLCLISIMQVAKELKKGVEGSKINVNELSKALDVLDSLQRKLISYGKQATVEDGEENSWWEEEWKPCSIMGKFIAGRQTPKERAAEREENRQLFARKPGAPKSTIGDFIRQYEQKHGQKLIKGNGRREITI